MGYFLALFLPIYAAEAGGEFGYCIRLKLAFPTSARWFVLLVIFAGTWYSISAYTKSLWLQKIIDIRKHFTTYSVFFAQNYSTYSHFVGWKNTTCFVFCLCKGLHAFLISANLCRGDRRGVWFRVLYDVLRTHSTFRGEDNSPLRKGNLYDYVDRAYN